MSRRRVLPLLLAVGALALLHACSPGQTESRTAAATLPVPGPEGADEPAVVAIVGTVTAGDGAVVPGARVLLVANGRTPGPEMPSHGICDGAEKAWNETVSDSSGHYWSFLRSERGGPVCYAVVVDPPAAYGRRTIVAGVPGDMRGADRPDETRIDVQVHPAD
jgi:hypothetical protein